jgi:hypothetical protein
VECEVFKPILERISTAKFRIGSNPGSHPRYPMALDPGSSASR